MGKAMTDKPRNIVIVGAGIGSRLIKVLLEEKLSGVKVTHVTYDDIPDRHSESGERMIICEDSQSVTVSSKELIAKLKQSERDLRPEASMREFYADRRYQKPPRLRGAAQHKRQAKKSKGKRK